MKLPLAIMLVVLPLLGCSISEEQNNDTAKKEAANANLEGAKIEEVRGNEGHNLLARHSPLERAMALAAVVKQLENKQYCSPERTFYRGRGKTDSFWAVQCHDGTAFQVMIRKDGSGGVLDCATMDRIDPKNGCWVPLPNRS